ncbi:MAG: GNAT family N-acetyltransferase [Promethearchaeota archaeon]
MKNSIKLEKASIEDAEILAKISKKAFDSDHLVGSPFGKGGPPGYDSPDSYIRLMKGFECYKILINSKIIGFMAYNPKKKTNYVMERIFIDPDYHKRGIASEAMSSLFNKFPDVVWTLETPEWNKRTRNFYKKNGFRQVGLEHTCNPGGKWKCIWYQRDCEGVEIIQKIGDLKDGSTDVIVKGIVKNITEGHKVKLQSDEEELTVATVILEDETGQIKFTLWNKLISCVKLNKPFRIDFGKVTSYNNELQLNVDWYGRIIEITQ